MSLVFFRIWIGFQCLYRQKCWICTFLPILLILVLVSVDFHLSQKLEMDSGVAFCVCQLVSCTVSKTNFSVSFARI